MFFLENFNKYDLSLILQLMILTDVNKLAAIRDSLKKRANIGALSRLKIGDGQVTTPIKSSNDSVEC